MKQASISEFFEKNKHFLGYDTLQRSIITAVKEAADSEPLNAHSAALSTKLNRALLLLSILIPKGRPIIGADAFVKELFLIKDT